MQSKQLLVVGLLQYSGADMMSRVNFIAIFAAVYAGVLSKLTHDVA
jgi:hypothetical protein